MQTALLTLAQIATYAAPDARYEAQDCAREIARYIAALQNQADRLQQQIDQIAARLDPRAAATAQLLGEFADWCDGRSLPHDDAATLAACPDLDADARAWLRDWLARWDAR